MVQDFQLKEEIRSVFAVLSENDAKNAHKHLKSYLKRLPVSSFYELVWVDLDRHGKFVRGGITDTYDYTTKLIAKLADDNRVKTILSIATEEKLKAGTIITNAEKDEFLWCLPFLSSKEDKAPQQHLRVLLVTYDLFDQVINGFNEAAKLTKAERRMIFQLCAGLTLSEAASSDDVTHETKRSQTKSSCSKLGCNGQKDLVSLALSQLVQLLSVSNTEADHVRIAEQFVADHLYDDARLTVQRLSNDHLLRLLEAGPADGTPVLVFHGMLFPLLLKQSAKFLEKNRIKLIVPVREGYLQRHSSRQLLEDTDSENSNLENISLFLKTSGYSKISILGQSAGAYSALRFAKNHPDSVEKIILLSPNFGGERRKKMTMTDMFFDGLQELSGRPGLFRFLSWEFKRYYADESNARAALLRLFGTSSQDKATLEGNNGGTPVSSWFVSYYQSSVNGFADDMHASRRNVSKLTQSVKKPLIFLHGDDDSSVSPTFISSLINHPRRDKIIMIKNAGHFSYAAQPEFVWQTIKDELANKA